MKKDMKKVHWFMTTLSLLILFVACKNNNTAAEAKTKETAKTATAPSEKKTIVFFGNSLTAGYGLSPSQAFPALIQSRIDSLNLPYKVVNAGVSGETSSGGN